MSCSAREGLTSAGAVTTSLPTMSFRSESYIRTKRDNVATMNFITTSIYCATFKQLKKPTEFRSD